MYGEKNFCTGRRISVLEELSTGRESAPVHAWPLNPQVKRNFAIKTYHMFCSSFFSKLMVWLALGKTICTGRISFVLGE